MATNSTSFMTVTVTETQRTTIIITTSAESSTDTATTPTLSQKQTQNSSTISQVSTSSVSTITAIATKIEMVTSTQSQTVTSTDTSISTPSEAVSSSGQSSSGTSTNSNSETTSSSTDSVSSSISSTSVSSPTTSTASQTSNTSTKSSSTKSTPSNSSSISSSTSSSSISSSTSSSASSTASSTNPTTSSVTVISTTSSETSTITSSLTSALNQDTTTSLATITTSINGQLTTLTSAVPPTSLSTDSDSHQNLRHVALIAGTTIGAVVIVSFVLGVLFFYRRHQHRRVGFIEALIRGRREHQGAGSIGLLDAEFDDDDNIPVSRYEDNPRAMPSASLAPSLFRPRVSDSGSVFREDIGNGVKFVDPFVESVGSKVDLSTIVDNVMGPAPPSPAHANVPSASHISVGSDNSLYQDPSRDMSHSSSIYHHVPSSSSLPQSLLGLPAGAALPKRPSPLANTLITTDAPPNPSHSQESSIQSQASKNWIERSPKKVTASLNS